VNYGALTPEDPNPLLYIINGLFGGYNAAYSSARFFYTDYTYAQEELRDLWSYKLKLDSRQKKELINHSWEIMRMKFPYYFISDNCGYRVGELIELVTDKRINSENSFYAVPHDLFDSVYKNKLVTSIERIESKTTIMTRMFNTLNTKQKNIALNIERDEKELEREHYKKEKEISKTQILEFLINYYSFRITRSFDQKLVEKRNYFLIKRSELMIHKNKWDSLPGYAPHEGQNPTSLGVGYLKDYPIFRIRPAYYDLLSPSLGRYQQSEIKLLDTKVTGENNRLLVDYIELLSVVSMNISNTGLKDDGGYAWKVRVIFEPQARCRECLVTHGSFGVGKATIINRTSLIYAFAEAHGYGNREDNARISISPSIGLIADLGFSRTKLELRQDYFIEDSNREQNNILIESRIFNSKKLDYSIFYRKKANDERHGAQINIYY
jgi:hypothetical protein